MQKFRNRGKVFQKGIDYDGLVKLGSACFVNIRPEFMSYVKA